MGMFKVGLCQDPDYWSTPAWQEFEKAVRGIWAIPDMEEPGEEDKKVWVQRSAQLLTKLPSVKDGGV